MGRKSDYGSVGHRKHNALHFMTRVKGVVLVGLIERVQHLGVERQASQVLWRATLFFPLQINKDVLIAIKSFNLY